MTHEMSEVDDIRSVVGGSLTQGVPVSGRVPGLLWTGVKFLYRVSEIP